jgi:D-mannonate dehydratase
MLDEKACVCGSKSASISSKPVIPEAEKAKMRLALHPNDPPVPISRGSEPIMASLVNMFAVMKQLVRQKCPRGLYPEHSRAIHPDRDRSLRIQYPGGGEVAVEIYNVAYAKAMLQDALSP